MSWRKSSPDFGANSIPTAAPTAIPSAKSEIVSGHRFRLLIGLLHFCGGLKSQSSILFSATKKPEGGHLAFLRQKSPPEVRHGIVKTLIGLCGIDRRFTGRGNVFRTGLLQCVFRSLDFIGSVAMNRKQDRAFLKMTFVALGFIFRNAQADQG